MDAVSARTRERRRPALLAHGLLALAAAWAAVGETRAVELVRPEEALMALFALETQIGMEQTLLAGIELRYQANVEERTRYGARLGRLYGELEAAWAAEEETFDEDAVVVGYTPGYHGTVAAMASSSGSRRRRSSPGMRGAACGARC